MPIKSLTQAINTNLIIGRLGTGKTSCLQSLLKTKPDTEFWVVIINEFGQLGLDAALLTPAVDNQQLAIAEISGGCICCSSKAQLQVSLTQLIRQYHPDRILIEATGLGHPAGIVDLLRAEHLASALRLDSIVCLADCRMFDTQPESSDSAEFNKKLLATQTIQHQFELADVIVLNKVDLASKSQIKLAKDYFQGRYPGNKQLVETSHGELDPSFLSIANPAFTSTTPRYQLHAAVESSQKVITYNAIDISLSTSTDHDYFSIGYLFPAEVRFDRLRLESFLQQLLPPGNLSIIRLKAVFNFGRFWYSYNATKESQQKTESFYRRDSRIELILSGSMNDQEVELARVQADLLSCINLAK